MFTVDRWWPQTGEAGTWQSYLWACIIVPVLCKLSELLMGVLERVMVRGAGEQAADLIRCQFSFFIMAYFGCLGGWAIYASPTPTQAMVALSSDIALCFTIEGASSKEYRMFLKLALRPSGAHLKPDKDGAGELGPSTPTPGLDHAESKIFRTRERREDSEQLPAYDPMRGERRLDPLESKIQYIACQAGSQLTPSAVIAAVVALMSLFPGGALSPSNLLVLFLHDFVYVLEGYVLLIGAQLAHGRVVTYASMKRRWNLYLVHDATSWLFYAIGTNGVAYTLLMSRMLGARVFSKTQQV